MGKGQKKSGRRGAKDREVEGGSVMCSNTAGPS